MTTYSVFVLTFVVGSFVSFGASENLRGPWTCDKDVDLEIALLIQPREDRFIGPWMMWIDIQEKNMFGTILNKMLNRIPHSKIGVALMQPQQETNCSIILGPLSTNMTQHVEAFQAYDIKKGDAWSSRAFGAMRDVAESQAMGWTTTQRGPNERPLLQVLVVMTYGLDGITYPGGDKRMCGTIPYPSTKDIHDVIGGKGMRVMMAVAPYAEFLYRQYLDDSLIRGITALYNVPNTFDYLLRDLSAFVCNELNHPSR